MYRSKGSAAPQRSSILGALKATEMLDSRPTLPAEILVAILDYLPVADLIRVARTSWRMREMVYDDTRWVARLRSMGCWNEVEARKRFDEAVRRRREAAEQAKAAARQNAREAKRGPSNQPQAPSGSTIFDASDEQKRHSAGVVVDGFEKMSLGPSQPSDPYKDPQALLDVIKNAKSIRGHAREEYGKIYGALAPFYFDLARAKSHTDPVVFQVFRDPEQQARMLANLQIFAKSDWAQGWGEREEKLSAMTGIFESAVVREFEQGYEFWDVDGRMRRYAHVLYTLNGGNAGVELFIHKHPIFNDHEIISANSADCINQASAEDVNLEPSRLFLDRLLGKVNEQKAIMERIFPEPEPVFWEFVDKVREEIVMEYSTSLFDAAHDRARLPYLKSLAGIFEQSVHFFGSLTPPATASKETVEAKAKEMMTKMFEPHIDLYLQEELDHFTKLAESEVATWEKRLSEQDASVESFLMSNFNRQADKTDFLSSFKKVVMMPVSVLPTFPMGSGSGKSTAANGAGVGSSQLSESETGRQKGSLDGGTSPLPEREAPTDELAAKAALMASRLEGIKSLFSIEVALNLVHAAQGSLQRAANLMRLGGQYGEEAREQCETIFIVLLRILGSRHVKTGFDRAVGHLSHYKAREVSEHDKSGVAPLVTFIELVNVGDLISQMIDVFYEQQLVGPKVADKNDFLDPAGLAKKRWEQMLDESVAAGLNKGIDVLMDEVEYLHGTLQLPTDYNPDIESTGGVLADPGPTQAAQRIVDLLSSHTRMLVGSTDKSMLDVFNGEVGLRLFTAVCKHLKRQRVSTQGAIKLIADMNLYFDYVRTLRNQDLLAYFKALRELSQIYLIEPRHAKEMATVIADGDRFGGIFRAEEVYEFAQRRADWYQVRKSVERAMYGMECSLM